MHIDKVMAIKSILQISQCTVVSSSLVTFNLCLYLIINMSHQISRMPIDELQETAYFVNLHMKTNLYLVK